MSINTFITEGNTAIEKKKYENALDLFDEAIRKSFVLEGSAPASSFLEAIYSLSKTFKIQGKWLAALSELWILAAHLKCFVEYKNEYSGLPQVFSEILSCIHQAEKEHINTGSNLEDLKASLAYSLMKTRGSENRRLRASFKDVLTIACKDENELKEIMRFVEFMRQGNDEFASYYGTESSKRAIDAKAEGALQIARNLNNKSLMRMAEELLNREKYIPLDLGVNC